MSSDQRHINNCLTHGLSAAQRIGHALVMANSEPVREALIDAMHSALIVVEEARQSLKADLHAGRAALAKGGDDA